MPSGTACDGRIDRRRHWFRSAAGVWYDFYVTHLDITHDAPTPIGMTVWAEAEIVSVSENGRMVEFKVSAWDEKGPVGAGTHTRAIIKNEKFLTKCNAKLEK